MGWIPWDIEASTLLPNKILNNKLLTGPNKTPKAAPQLREKIKDYCTRQFQVPITHRWGNSFVLRDTDEIMQATSSSQEEQSGCSSVEGCPTERVFNLHQVAISDKENRKTGRVVVSETKRDQTIHLLENYS
jgi:hypothetical protein